jgi:hypothetical protein
MSVPVPTQIRTLDPGDENRWSSTINRFTRIFTGGTDVLLFPDESFQASPDSTNLTCVSYTPGKFIKDDMFIEITNNFVVDFSVLDNYLDEIPGMISTGWYHVVLWFNSTRTFPPPNAYLRILRNRSLFKTYQSNYLFLSAVRIIQNPLNNSQYIVDRSNGSILEQDPDDSTIKRNWLYINWIQ